MQALIQDISFHDQKMNSNRFNSYGGIRLLILAKWSESGHTERTLHYVNSF